MAWYTPRQIRNVTYLALFRLAFSTPDSEASSGLHDQAKAALAELDGTPVPEVARAALDRLDGRELPRRELLWREQVQPGLWVVIEDSHNILLELTTPDGGQVIARTDPIGGTDLPVAITVARVKVAELDDQAEAARLAGLRERRGE